MEAQTTLQTARPVPIHRRITLKSAILATVCTYILIHVYLPTMFTDLELEVDLGLDASSQHLEARQKSEPRGKGKNITKCVWPAQIDKAAMGTTPLKLVVGLSIGATAGLIISAFSAYQAGRASRPAGRGGGAGGMGGGMY